MRGMYCVLTVLVVTSTASAGLPEALLAIRGVQEEGQGNERASKAWKQVAQADPSEIPQILSAMDGANPLVQNWLRAAVDAVAQRQPKGLSVEDLAAFVGDRRHSDAARETAFRLLGDADPKAADKLVPGMLDDPCVAFRRQAVGRLIDEAKRLADAGKAEEAVEVRSRALDAARDVDQIQTLAKALREAGREVNLPAHFGFLMEWKVVGPFANKDRKGFEVVYPPETEAGSAVNLAARYPGIEGSVEWKDLVCTHEYGMVDLNKPYGPLKEVVGYAYTQFHSNQARDVELRLGCKNAWKVWLNGKLLFHRDEYHRGMQIDQYVMKASLQAGPNHILVKLCQNEQREEWTKEWQFQLRVCDSTGTAVHADAPPFSADTRTVSRND